MTDYPEAIAGLSVTIQEITDISRLWHFRVCFVELILEQTRWELRLNLINSSTGFPGQQSS
jgi:hypothetical protein